MAGSCGPHGLRPVGFILRVCPVIRSACFIDGFNLYHALKRLKQPQVKWLDLMALMQRQVHPKSEAVVSVQYFSAYADWWPQRRAKHQQYVAALRHVGVDVILGQFKVKDRRCPSCGHTWQGHEEKETDVNIALALLDGAYQDKFDRAYVVSRDSDLKPAMALVRQRFPSKEVHVVAPPHFGHSNDLVSVANGKRKITLSQLNQCLLPPVLYDSNGTVIATRPANWV